MPVQTDPRWRFCEETGDRIFWPWPDDPEPDQDADRLHRLRLMQADQADDLIDELIDAGAIGLSAATPDNWYRPGIS